MSTRSGHKRFVIEKKFVIEDKLKIEDLESPEL